MALPPVPSILSVLGPPSSVLDRIGGPARLALTIGQQLRARVLDVTGDVVRLSVGDQTMAAETRANLAAGDQVQLQVRSIAPDRVEFQLLDPGDAPPALRLAGRADLANLLESLGLSSSATNLEI